ncbi:MAG: exo-beta-N-acetylmuramidase NamZ domain-containing protein [Hyphomicrobiales bacterium]
MCKYKFLGIILLIVTLSICKLNAQSLKIITENDIRNGIEQTKDYFPLIKGKRIGVVANPSSILPDHTHLVDFLIDSKMNVIKVFSPEHGFRGKAEAGEKINNSVDKKTGIRIISLYGKHKKPTKEDFNDIDIILFDLQDVGARFYTYISTLAYVMEAAAENNKPVIILDRPNPNGFYVDGPILKQEEKSFVGLLPIPIVHGMTLGELAKMIKGENWYPNDQELKIDLTVIPVIGYKHNYIYKLPVKPSPNLPDFESIYLYPSLCLFEGTIISVGRGTKSPFTIFGHPKLNNKKRLDKYAKRNTFTPHPIPGASLKPKLNGQLCKGFDLRKVARNYKTQKPQLELKYLIYAYQNTDNKEGFFNNFFNKLAGNKTLQQQIKSGKTEKEIRNSWKEGLESFKRLRKTYLLYP